MWKALIEWLRADAAWRRTKAREQQIKNLREIRREGPEVRDILRKWDWIPCKTANY